MAAPHGRGFGRGWRPEFDHNRSSPGVPHWSQRGRTWSTRPAVRQTSVGQTDAVATSGSSTTTPIYSQNWSQAGPGTWSTRPAVRQTSVGQTDAVATSGSSTTTPIYSQNWSQAGPGTWSTRPAVRQTSVGQTDAVTTSASTTTPPIYSQDWSQAGRTWSTRPAGRQTSVGQSDGVATSSSTTTAPIFSSGWPLDGQTLSRPDIQTSNEQIESVPGPSSNPAPTGQQENSNPTTDSLNSSVTAGTATLSSAHCQLYRGIGAYEVQSESHRNLGVPRTPYPAVLPPFYDELIAQASDHCQQFHDNQARKDGDFRVLFDEQWYLKGEKDWSSDIGTPKTTTGEIEIVQGVDPNILSGQHEEPPLDRLMTTEEKHVRDIRQQLTDGRRTARRRKADTKKQKRFDGTNAERIRQGEEPLPSTSRPWNRLAQQPYRENVERARNELSSLNLASSRNYVPDYLGQWDDDSLAASYTVDPEEFAKYKSSKKVQLVGDGNICSICRDDIVDATLEDLQQCRFCSKIFHERCVIEWVVKKKKCPMCRAFWPPNE